MADLNEQLKSLKNKLLSMCVKKFWALFGGSKVKRSEHVKLVWLAVPFVVTLNKKQNERCALEWARDK